MAAVAVLAFLLLVLAPGPAAQAGLTGVAVPGAVAASAVSADPSGVRPAADDAYMGSSPVVLRPPRDAGERSVPAGPLLFTPPYTPAIPPRPAPPAPVHGNAPPDAAHLPGDLGRAPPAASST
ncbi:hypothetical protein HCJ93_18890 [Streptomyces sp. SBST2-5]|uniref:Uncharacterized protein n=1 Tax=Streptomyces composti TaxID=2720025 RepID=A0ABX1AEU9_9ACTN|nr:hypothetical protein [Streptomyces composti]NJP52058.1 hypothetical protein [Streptomyces composti]